MSYYQKYLDYIKNTGRSPTIAWFDDDWDPVGPMVRKDLLKMGLVEEVDGKLMLSGQIVKEAKPD